MVAENGKPAEKLPADEYVLVPDTIYGAGNGAGPNQKNDTSYTLRRLEDFGWVDHEGFVLGQKTDPAGNDIPQGHLGKMFDMRQSVDWSYQLGIGGIDLPNLSPGGTVLQVPVGDGLYQRVIGVPTGSLAFYVNQASPENPARIRAVVKVPSFEGPPDETGTKIRDYYLGLWEGQEKSNSWLHFYSFNKNNAYLYAEMPLSQRLIPATQNDPKKPPTVNEKLKAARMTQVSYNGTPYQTYLQGEHFLMACEFTVPKEGVYILATASSDIRNDQSFEESPLQIVYCAADGIASSGRDGTGGSPLGNIDYVYHNPDTNQIIPVTAGPKNKEPENGENIKKMYYRSNLMVYFDNLPRTGTPPAVNQELTKIYRSVLSAKSPNGVWAKTQVQIGQNSHVRTKPLGGQSDQIEVLN